MRDNFRVRFKEMGVGRNGGCGAVKEFIMNGSKKARKRLKRKMRKRSVQVLSVRKA